MNRTPQRPARHQPARTFAVRNTSTIPPTIAGDTIYVALDGGMVEAFNKDTLAKKWTLGGLSAGGQNSCPVLVSEGRVYTGFYDSETGTQNYVCLTTAGKRVWSYANAGGFYWHGRRGAKRRKRNLTHFELPQG